MSTTSPFVILSRPCDEAVAWAVRRLNDRGLQVMRTFDLQDVRLAHLDCACPHHGTALCNCQLVVLLVYQGEAPPATLVIHGNDEASWFYLINKPQQPVGHHLEKYIQEALSLEIDTKA